MNKLIIFALVTLALAGSATALYFTSYNVPTTALPGEESVTVPLPTPRETDRPLPSPRTAAPATNATTYSGAILAGTSAPLLDFNQQDFAAAQQSDKIIVLYFYANWCPICRAEFPKMQAAFNELTTDEVIGFRVNFNDNETDKDEEALARQHGVAYQHTKVIVKNGTQILKSPETWSKDRYLTEITQAK